VDILIAILILVLLAAVVAVVGQPLRAARRTPDQTSAGRGEQEAAREAKYREIRDAELDFRTGKLSREDYETIDGALRAEAVEILNRLAALEQEPAAEA
jgi:type II secretory pathway pseudopilin PulG